MRRRNREASPQPDCGGAGFVFQCVQSRDGRAAQNEASGFSAAATKGRHRAGRQGNAFSDGGGGNDKGGAAMQRNIIEFTRASDTPDADFSHLRGVEVLHKLLRRYPADAAKLERAHGVLKGEPNYAPAMHRVAYSLHEGRIRAFISYRVGVDAEAARTVAEVFRALSSQQVTVTFADEFTTRIAGQDYKSEIESATKAAHWFVILISESGEASGWCMYETGMFRASATSANASLPSAIDGFQSVSGDVAHLQRFLDGLFRRADPLPGWEALNPSLDDATILEAATRIAHALRPPRKPVAFTYRATLEVRGPERLAIAADLDACAVATDRLTANLFGKVEPPQTWGQLLTNVRPAGGSSPWLEELVAVLRKASAGNVFRPMTGTFESAQGGRVMRPVLHSMEHDGLGDEFKFHLFFLEDFSSTPAHGIAPRTRALLRAVRMHNRVRWEVLERFADADWSPDEIEACAKAFSRIDRELQAQGGSDTEALRSHYVGGASDEIEAIAEDWQDLRDGATGRLTMALRQLDADGVRRGIAQCRKLNQRFFELTFPVLEEITRRQG
jgi:hypothetical protein